MQHENETIDSLRGGDLRIIQGRDGYRFSLDPVLLAGFVELRGVERMIDLGTGAGILPLLLAHSNPAAEIVGLEIQADQVDRARRTLALNNLDQRIQIVAGDLRQIRQLFPAEHCQLVISNPPYRKPGNGRIAPNKERAAARHELAGGLEDFIAAAAWLLKHGGRLALIYLAERLPELFRLLGQYGLEPKRLRMIQPRQNEPAKMLLLEARKGGRPGLTVEPALIVYAGAGRDYSQEVLHMYGEKG